MKKLICVLLSAALLLPLLSGCRFPGSLSPASHSLQVGYGRVDISPQEPVPLAGYGNAKTRISTEVTERLYTTCIAFTDEADNTVLLFHNDLSTCSSTLIPLIRRRIEAVTGIPWEQIMVTATHTHSAPSLATTSASSIQRYTASLEAWMIEAAQQALNDRKPAQMYATSTKVTGLNYVRHYIMDDGSYVGDNFGSSKGKQYVRHVCDPDDSMQLVKFVREGGEDVLLVNWQGHPHRAGGAKKTNVSSDIVGVMRESLEKSLNCKFAYFTGASGDVNNHSRIEDEKITEDVYEHGDALAKYAVAAASGFEKKEIGNVQLLHRDYVATLKGTTRTREMDINAFSLGDVAFVTAPYEMFTANGMTIKDGSPFATTFICTCANEGRGYLPAEHAFAYNSYEVDVTYYEKGTAESIAATYVEMLQELHNLQK